MFLFAYENVYFFVSVLEQADGRSAKHSAAESQSKQQTTVEFIHEEDEVNILGT